MKYSTYITKIIPTAFSLIIFTVLSCNTAFGADAPPSCTKAYIGCWSQGDGLKAVNPIKVERTFIKVGNCKINDSAAYLQYLCQDVNPNSKKVIVQVKDDSVCHKMPGYISGDGYFDETLKVCVIPQ